MPALVTLQGELCEKVGAGGRSALSATLHSPEARASEEYCLQEAPHARQEVHRARPICILCPYLHVIGRQCQGPQDTGPPGAVIPRSGRNCQGHDPTVT